jgi:hypothetical protein
MRIKVKHIVLSAIMLAVLPAAILNTQAVAAPSKESQEQAMAVLKRMTEFLGQAQSFSVTAESGFDVVQPTGERIEFGETRVMTIRRPDHLRVDETKRNGSVRQVIFDGKDIYVYHAREKVYASNALAGSVDDAISYFVNDLGMRLPLSEMLSSKIAQSLPEKVRSAAYVEQSFVAGVACDHAVFYGDKAVLQLWVAKGDKPLPQRIVITYIKEDGQPQFWAQLSNWNLAPESPDAFFVFTPPEGARKISFSGREQLKTGAPTSNKEVKK